MFDRDHLLRETFVRHVELHARLPSTNDHALQMAGRNDLELPVLILADRQTAGRGRQSNRWWSAPGALTFSVVADVGDLPTGPLGRARLSLASALAVAETLTTFLPAADIGLKWPNDVLIAGRKVSGILLETTGAAAERIVIGIGLNVNNPLASAPPPLRETATSMLDAAGETFDANEILLRLLQCLEIELQDMQEESNDLTGRWHRHCVLRGRRVRLNLGEREVSGMCGGIDPGGALLLQTPYGIDRYFSGSVVEYL